MGSGPTGDGSNEDRLGDVSVEAVEVRPGSVSSSPDPREEEEELVCKSGAV